MLSARREFPKTTHQAHQPEAAVTALYSSHNAKPAAVSIPSRAANLAPFSRLLGLGEYGHSSPPDVPSPAPPPAAAPFPPSLPASFLNTYLEVCREQHKQYKFPKVVKRERISSATRLTMSLVGMGWLPSPRLFASPCGGIPWANPIFLGEVSPLREA